MMKEKGVERTEAIFKAIIIIGIIAFLMIPIKMLYDAAQIAEYVCKDKLGKEYELTTWGSGRLTCETKTDKIELYIDKSIYEEKRIYI